MHAHRPRCVELGGGDIARLKRGVGGVLNGGGNVATRRPESDDQNENQVGGRKRHGVELLSGRRRDVKWEQGWELNPGCPVYETGWDYASTLSRHSVLPAMRVGSCFVVRCQVLRNGGT